MTPIEIEQRVKTIEKKIDSLLENVRKETEKTLEKLVNDVNKLKVEIEILKQGGNL